MHSQELFDLSRDLFPGGVNSPVRFYQPFPRFMQRGKGSRIFDIDGNEYIDYCLGFGPMILGHADESVITAIKEQSSDGSLLYLLQIHHSLSSQGRWYPGEALRR